MFTVPPAVALLNYISCGILWRIFLPNWDNSRGFLINDGRISEGHNMENKKRQKESYATPTRIFFPKTGISLYYINFAQRNSEAAMGEGGRIYF
jgi:hypothetical protein